MYAPYDPKTASTEDRVAWTLCQIIDDDAPLRWARYRFSASCIATNAQLMADLAELAAVKAKRDALKVDKKYELKNIEKTIMHKTLIKNSKISEGKL